MAFDENVQAKLFFQNSNGSITAVNVFIYLASRRTLFVLFLIVLLYKLMYFFNIKINIVQTSTDPFFLKITIQFVLHTQFYSHIFFAQRDSPECIQFLLSSIYIKLHVGP